ncbi:cytochrome d ubiquinol oxidase subunit II [Actinomycetospora cinnamomea]|uniref:Cytochrome bd-I ubiquinol oxidase subunit 2 apoprotein n=1 Tax=Actinomycetospora cinnamomea TaxID=663609 RepID=A0A2U1FRJ9_9PSEU|nr:cytochrome d ubiquinol oxidase subunit II [Actinomycetospora cinnamomea]PVZ14690.1 cytochrome bd-I ubiquinol oxidase subunit 2 apoprotein [Actinomycetospora cinnamomea]
MDLPTLWFALAVTCWVLFFVLEGFDFGVGVLAGALGRDDHERGAGVTTIGPVWDGNEVWLVAAVGVTFAAFPDWYAALMSGLYLPFVLILLALAARGVALEFRGKGGTTRFRAVCDAVLAGSSLAVAALWGAVLGVLATGLALGPGGEVVGDGLGRSLAPLVEPPALLGAALGVTVALVQGATFLGLRTTGPLRARARTAALAALVPTAVLVALVAPVGLVAVAVVAVLVAVRREVLAFAAASVAVAAGVVGVLAAHLPVVLPSTLDPAASLTIAGAAASPGALRLITLAAVLVLPGVVAYQVFSYWVFRRRVASERVAT